MMPRLGLLWAVATGACSDPASGGDVAPAEDAATEDAAATETTDAAGPDSEDAVPPDGGAADAPDGGKPDVKPPVDAALPSKGCAGNDDCSGLVLTTCQAPQCNKETGLCQFVNLPDGATCPDAAGDQCKVGAVCKAGACTYGLKACDDGNPCTDENCQADSGCSSKKVANKLCTDGNACSVGTTCVDGACKAKSQLACDDKNVCTVDSCDAKVGCVHLPAVDGAACDDGDVCIESESCFDGKCVGKPKVCLSGTTQCKLSKCVSKNNQGCTEAALVGLPCDDGKPCTAIDICDSAGSCVGTPLSCDDKNPCTDDSCDDKTGCKHAPNTKPCGGSDACATAGTCTAGKCTTTPVNCEDGNLCTENSCDKLLGCKAKFVPSACFDGNICTENDACDNGACKPGTPNTCNDGNGCTTDTCDVTAGCAQSPAAYGADCGGGKKCAVGLCLADDCGDGWCAAGENSTACAKDCPEEGGACAPTDGACLANCKATKCSTVDSACKAKQGCPEIGTCLGGCGTDAKCQVDCIKAASLAAGQAQAFYDQCMQAFCVQNSWIGKKCAGGGPQYVACVEACESAMCKLSYLLCKASTGCQQVRACLQACNAGDPGLLLGCIAGCKSKGSAEDVTINAELDSCSGKYCQ
ncbi:MAG: hypothetical protein FJ100_22220 [Deltaproteobacteria bacterium]|nr:hypothetical protein [Deltaproteobacteria bacterium]